MSRMVRDSQVSGLRERQWFAQVLLRQLQQRQQDGAALGELLALRGAVLFHLYSALVGLARNAGSNYAVAEIDQLLSLPSLAHAFARQQVQSPEMNLIEAARTDAADAIHWLEQQVMAANAASGLARRPLPPQEEGTLAMVADDPNVVLASGDIERLHSAVARVKEILEAAAAHMEEW
jgi:hypothetical protein